MDSSVDHKYIIKSAQQNIVDAISESKIRSDAHQQLLTQCRITEDYSKFWQKDLFSANYVNDAETGALISYLMSLGGSAQTEAAALSLAIDWDVTRAVLSKLAGEIKLKSTIASSTPLTLQKMDLQKKIKNGNFSAKYYAAIQFDEDEFALLLPTNPAQLGCQVFSASAHKYMETLYALGLCDHNSLNGRFVLYVGKLNTTSTPILALALKALTKQVGIDFLGELTINTLNVSAYRAAPWLLPSAYKQTSNEGHLSVKDSTLVFMMPNGYVESKENNVRYDIKPFIAKYFERHQSQLSEYTLYKYKLGSDNDYEIADRISSLCCYINESVNQWLNMTNPARNTRPKFYREVYKTEKSRSKMHGYTGRNSKYNYGSYHNHVVVEPMVV